MLISNQAELEEVIELDASALDGEFLNVIRNYLELYVSNISASPLWTIAYKGIKRLAPLLYYSHILSKGFSPGQDLLGCRYTNFTLHKRVLLYLFEYFVPLVLTAIKEDAHTPKITKIVEKVLAVTGGIQLINYIFFLSCGGSLTISRRILCLKTEVPSHALQGRLNNSNINRELIGHCFANVFMVLKPLIDSTRRYLISHASASSNITESNLVTCSHCSSVAVVALEAETEDGRSIIFCNYCYYVAKQKQRFISVTTFSLSNK